jgi:hypothetical protein
MLLHQRQPIRGPKTARRGVPLWEIVEPWKWAMPPVTPAIRREALTGGPGGGPWLDHAVRITDVGRSRDVERAAGQASAARRLARTALGRGDRHRSDRCEVGLRGGRQHVDRGHAPGRSRHGVDSPAHGRFRSVLPAPGADARAVRRSRPRSRAGRLRFSSVSSVPSFTSQSASWCSSTLRIRSCSPSSSIFRAMNA